MRNNVIKKITRFFFIFLFSVVHFGCRNGANDNSEEGTTYLTLPHQQVLLQKLEDRISMGDSASGNPTIKINSSVTYQEMDGFGFTLTGGSAMHLNAMSAEARQHLLNELFGDGENDLNLSYLRVSIGASDLDEKTFSYNDLPEGETDENMDLFSLAPDHEHLIPVLKEILEIDPEIKILGSPWSPPVWMKTFDIPVEVDRDPDLPPTVGGGLDPQYEAAYANYFVKYIQGMAEEGITIDAITVQNEPYHYRNNPSLHMEPEQMRDFIKNHLGPAFSEAGITTKIIIWDHNANRPSYPISILDDEEARMYIDGSAFHLYDGDISALSTVKQAHPDKHLYFTEQYVDARGNFENDIFWHIENLIIRAPRNWSKTVLQWNLTSNEQLTPYTSFGGCSVCLGAVTVEGDEVTRNQGYYIMGHISRFVDAGSVRVESNLPDDLLNVAFKNTEGDIVLIVMNKSERNIDFDIVIDGKVYTTTLSVSGIATYIL